MNNYDHGSAQPPEPPEDPHVRSEPHLLSPASPKPIHIPQPTSIPVLENMMDVGYNQTEAHMGDPAMRNTELRPGAWRDPNEASNEEVDHASPFSTGGEATEQPAKDDEASATEPALAEVDAHSSSTETLANEPDVQHISNGISYEANSHLPAGVVPEDNHTPADAQPPSSDPSVPTAEQTAPNADASLTHPTEIDQAHAQTASSAYPASTAPADAIVSAQTPSQPPTQASVPGADLSSPLSSSGFSGLPPRPPPQDQPLINPHYAHSQHIRDYHPHASHPALHAHAPSNSSGNAAQTSAASFVTPSLPATPQVVPGGNNAYQSHSPAVDQPVSQNLPNYQQQLPVSNTPIESRREYKLAAGETPTIDDQPWTQDIQRKYDHFLDEERRYVNEAKWDQFPLGSRLFVGNLSSEKVTKRDIFHVFHNYGELAQVSIKQAYGFVQFLKPEDCARALVSEQGRQISDKRIHLEVSKPQKAARNQQNNARRSRSPDYGGRGKRGNDGDRYQSNGRGGGHGRNRESRDMRDGYRPGHRSPSPRGYRDRREDRFSTRSRSPAFGNRDRDRYMRGSPRREPEDDLPLPRRSPKDVPDVQLIALDPLERDFISWVEAEFSKRGVRVDVLMISPRLNEDAVVRRQILEGVLAVSRLRRRNQDESKIGLTIFKRKSAIQDVQYEEYDHLDPNIACELVLREKRAIQGPAQPGAGQYSNGYQGQYGGQQPPPQQYGYQQGAAPYAPPSGFQQPYAQQPYAYGAQPRAVPGAGAPQPPPPNVDPNDLQNLLANLGQGGPPPPFTGGPAQYGTPAPQPGYPPQPHGQQAYPPQAQPQGYPPQNHQYSPPQQGPPPAYHNNPAMSGMPGGQPGVQPPSHQQQQPPGQPPVNMQDVLARLGNYRP